MTDNDPEVDALASLIVTSFLGPGEQLAVTMRNGVTVSTAKTHDVGWETAVSDATGEWFPVQRYGDDQVAAMQGHMEWEERAASATVVIKLGYMDVIPDTEVTLRRRDC